MNVLEFSLNLKVIVYIKIKLLPVVVIQNDNDDVDTDTDTDTDSHTNVDVNDYEFCACSFAIYVDGYSTFKLKRQEIILNNKTHIKLFFIFFLFCKSCFGLPSTSRIQTSV